MYSVFESLPAVAAASNAISPYSETILNLSSVSACCINDLLVVVWKNERKGSPVAESDSNLIISLLESLTWRGTSGSTLLSPTPTSFAKVVSPLFLIVTNVVSLPSILSWPEDITSPSVPVLLLIIKCNVSCAAINASPSNSMSGPVALSLVLNNVIASPLSAAFLITMFPTTDNGAVGAFVPIPILPSLSILICSSIPSAVAPSPV